MKQRIRKFFQGRMHDDEFQELVYDMLTLCAVVATAACWYVIFS